MKKGLSSKLSKRITSKIAAKPSSKDSKDYSKDSKDDITVNAKDFSSMRDQSKRNLAEGSKINNFVIQHNRNYNEVYKIKELNNYLLI